MSLDNLNDEFNMDSLDGIDDFELNLDSSEEELLDFDIDTTDESEPSDDIEEQETISDRFDDDGFEDDFEFDNYTEDTNDGFEDIADLVDSSIDESDSDFDVMAEYHDGPSDDPYANDDNIGDGAIVDSADLLADDEEPVIDKGAFINDTGNIVVQEASDDVENGFEIVYLNIENIGITQRIRKMQSVDDLVTSIQSTGLLKPLMVAPTATEGLYVLLDGFRRIQACARAGKTRVPCIVNNKVNTPEIPILEAMYNHFRKYSIKEQIDYINYLETQQGIMNPGMIEYLLQMNSGDYTKLKDILNDGDPDIVVKLYEGAYDIATAFKKLEQRRKKETLEERENKKAAKVYDDEEESGADKIQGSGEEADGDALTDEQIQSLALNADTLDDDLEDTSISEMIEEDKNIEGFKPHKQKVGERETIDPAIRKAVMTRDNSTCACCKRGGQQYVDILDYHHVVPVHLGGVDSVDNGIMLCVACHRMVHLYATDDLHIDSALLQGEYDDLDENKKMRYPNAEIFEDEKMRLKRIIKLGGRIRKGIAQQGLNREQYKKEHSNAGIGRRKPGKNAEQEIL